MRLKITEDNIGNRVITPVSKALIQMLEEMGRENDVFVQMRSDWEYFCELCNIGKRTRDGLARWGVTHVNVPLKGFFAFVGVEI